MNFGTIDVKTKNVTLRKSRVGLLLIRSEERRDSTQFYSDKF
jgi:hypothetical protein